MMVVFYLASVIVFVCHADVIRGYQDSHPLNLATIWGQNYAEPKIGVREPELIDLCTKSPYDTIVVGYVNKFFDSTNGNYPGIDFSIHCQNQNIIGASPICPNIEEAIKACHDNNKKVLIGIGGAGAQPELTKFLNENYATTFASTIWRMFLSGPDGNQFQQVPRPFGSAILDGVNIDIRHRHTEFLNVFIQRMEEFRTTQNVVRYITITATCNYPNPYLGPGPGKPLEDSVVADAVDKIYVLFIKESCCIAGSPGYETSMQRWNTFSARTQTDLGLGIASNQYTSQPQCFNPADKVVNSIKTWQQKNPLLSSIMLVDNSFDITNNKRYLYSTEIERIYSQPPVQPIIVATTPPPLITKPPEVFDESEPDTPVEPEVQPEAPVVPETPEVSEESEPETPEEIEESEPELIQPNESTEPVEPIKPAEPIETETLLEPEISGEMPVETLEPVSSDDDEIVVVHTTLPPLVDEEDNLVVDSTMLATSTRPPPTRAPPLIPEVAQGSVPPNGLGGWGQAAEIQKKHNSSCTNMNVMKNYAECVSPDTRKHHGKNKNKKGVRVRFKSSFKPNYIPIKKQQQQQQSFVKKRKPKKIEIKFKSKFKPSLIPVSQQSFMKKKKKPKKIEIKFKSKFKPSLIPVSQQSFMKKKKKKPKKIEIKFKSKFKPSMIPISQQSFVKKKDKNKSKPAKIDVKFKSKFKPSLIPASQKEEKQQKLQEKQQKSVYKQQETNSTTNILNITFESKFKPKIVPLTKRRGD